MAAEENLSQATDSSFAPSLNLILAIGSFRVPPGRSVMITLLTQNVKMTDTKPPQYAMLIKCYEISNVDTQIKAVEEP